ncbi:MAG: hypothetical protein ABIY70_23815 [Capsulimonas sp.]|uniref:hypothetical protein n=1 Tax=Capsulimonas sp. TaxID=2494211 RepID=UPI0032639A65
MPTEREVKRRYDQARIDAKKGKYAEALEGCLFFLDNGGSAGVRLSYTLSDIMALSEHLPDARIALETRRDRCEASILDGSGGWQEIHDFTSFNKYLDERDRSLALLEQISHIPKLQELHATLLNHLWERLATEGQYEKLASIIEDEARNIAGYLARHYVVWSFLTEGSDEHSRDLGMIRRQVAQASLAYEVLMAVHKDRVAETLLRWVLRCDPTGEAEALMSAAAAKAGRGSDSK